MLLVAVLLAGVFLAVKYRDSAVARRFLRQADRAHINAARERVLRALPDPRESATVRSLEKRLGELRGQWPKKLPTDQLRKRLEAIQKEMVAQRDKAAGSAREYWQDGAAKMDVLIRKTRERSAEIPKEIDEARNMLKEMERFRQFGRDAEKALKEMDPAKAGKKNASGRFEREAPEPKPEAAPEPEARPTVYSRWDAPKIAAPPGRGGAGE